MPSLSSIIAILRYPKRFHVETCALLVRESAQDDKVVSIKVDLDGIEHDQGRYVPPEKPTYKNIKQWNLDKYGFKVSKLYIAQIKDKVGLEKRKNYNPGSGDGKVPICPPEKEEAIMDAFRHNNLI
jgi:23S rRNA (uracil1939-C5)-methyltransferase